MSDDSSTLAPPASTIASRESSSRECVHPLALLGLLAIVCFSAWLSSTGVGFLLPHSTEPDGQVLESEVRLIQSDQKSADRGHGAGLYPQLLPRIAAAFVPPEGSVASGDDLSAHLRAASATRRAIRLVLALLAVLCVPATWSIARRFLAPSWSLAAAAFTATSFLSLWFAQQERPHGAAAAFSALAVVAALRLRRDPRPISFVIAGIAIGLAIGALQSGVAVLLPFASAIILRERTTRRAPLAWALASLAIVAAMAWFFYPFVFDPKLAPPGRSVELIGSDVKLSGHHIDLAWFNGSGLPTVFATLRDYEPLIAALALGGAAVWIVRALRRRFGSQRAPIDAEKRADLFVVLAYALPYLLAIVLFQRTYQRFVIPLVPYMACLAAYFLAAIIDWIARWRSPALARRVVTIAIIAAPIAVQSWAAYKLVSIRAAPDTIVQASRWIAEHAREKRILVEPALDMPLFQSDAALAANERMLRKASFPWSTYQWNVPPAARPTDRYELRTIGTSRDEVAKALLADPLGYVRGMHGDFAVVEVYAEWGWRPLRNLCAELRQHAELAARFTPDAPDAGDRWRDLPIEYQEEALRTRISWYARVLAAHCTGPIVEIYRLAP
jgi:hypothetical protein